MYKRQGVDNIDLNAAKEKNIIVMNTPGGNANATAEHAFALIMSVLRKTPFANETTHKGEWEKKNIKGTELSNKILGIVGFFDVPIGYFAVQMWRGIHPGPVIGPNAAPSSLEESMSTTLLFSVATFTVLFAVLMRERWSLICRTYVVKNVVRKMAFSKHRVDDNFNIGDS